MTVRQEAEAQSYNRSFRQSNDLVHSYSPSQCIITHNYAFFHSQTPTIMKINTNFLITVIELAVPTSSMPSLCPLCKDNATEGKDTKDKTLQTVRTLKIWTLRENQDTTDVKDTIDGKDTNDKDTTGGKGTHNKDTTEDQDTEIKATRR